MSIEFENYLENVQELTSCFPIKKFAQGNGSHWDITELYDDSEYKLELALQSKVAFTTGWYSVKKEIQSGRISRFFRDGKQAIICEASVSNDFDEQGLGSICFEANLISEDPELEEVMDVTRAIRSHLGEALEEAYQNQLDNKQVVLYAVLEIFEDGDMGVKESNWIESYVKDISPDELDDSPPGDFYHQWGWQGESSSIPQEVLDKLENHIHSARSDERFRYSNYEIKATHLEEEE